MSDRKCRACNRPVEPPVRGDYVVLHGIRYRPQDIERLLARLERAEWDRSELRRTIKAV